MTRSEVDNGRENRALIVTVVVLVGAACACAPDIGTIQAGGYRWDAYGLSIRFRDSRHQRFINGEWVLMNWSRRMMAEYYQVASAQEHRHETKPSAMYEWIPKDGERYYGYCRVDRDGDGTTERESCFLYCLLLKHRRTDGVIWAQVFDVPKGFEHKRLDVVLDNYVNSISGTGLYRQGSIMNIESVKARAFGARVVKKLELDGGEKLQALIDVVDLDRKKADPSYPGEKIMVELSRMWRRNGRAALLLLGYHNSSRYFEQHLADFKAFTQQVSIKGLSQEGAARRGASSAR